jgi:hypothetical protein
MPETDVAPLVAWSLQQDDGALLLYEFDQSTGRLQLNGEVEYVDSRAAHVLGVLLRHADSPVTNDDFLESGLQTKGGGAVRKAMDTLQKSHIVGKHILQIGNNKNAIYSLITNPNDTKLLEERMQNIRETLFMERDPNDPTRLIERNSKDARHYRETIRKLGVITAGIAGAATIYSVVRRIHKK